MKCDCFKDSAFDRPTHLEVRGDRAPAHVDEFCHVVVGIEGPDAALQVEVLIELEALALADVGVELVGAVVAGPQGDAVIRYIIEEARL